jgi:hypothetical protein
VSSRARHLNSVSAVIAKGKHPVPFRTRKLSSSAPMVLRGGPRGRVGRRRASSVKGRFRQGSGPYFFVSASTGCWPAATGWAMPLAWPPLADAVVGTADGWHGSAGANLAGVRLVGIVVRVEPGGCSVAGERPGSGRSRASSGEGSRGGAGRGRPGSGGTGSWAPKGGPRQRADRPRDDSDGRTTPAHDGDARRDSPRAGQAGDGNDRNRPSRRPGQAGDSPGRGASRPGASRRGPGRRTASGPPRHQGRGTAGRGQRPGRRPAGRLRPAPLRQAGRRR